MNRLCRTFACLTHAGWAATIVCATAAGQDMPGVVLVQTQPPLRGKLAETITAYGTATRAIAGGMTISVPAEGRVMHIAVAPGDAVHAGQALMEFRLSAAASSNYVQAASTLDVARQEKSRVQRLLEQQLATTDQLARADKALTDAQAALGGLEAEGAASQLQVIAAPFDGVVSAIPVAQGDRVAAGAPLALLTRGHGLVVTVGIEPSERARLKAGQSVRLEPLTEHQAPLHGSLVRIDHALNPKTRLIDADVAVAGELLQGESFRALIQTGDLTGWLVPRDAVLGDQDGDYLFQAAEGKAVRIAVKRVGGDDDRSVVEGPIDPKQPIVTVGNYQLKDGAALRQQTAGDGIETGSAPVPTAAPAPGQKTPHKPGS